MSETRTVYNALRRQVQDLENELAIIEQRLEILGDRKKSIVVKTLKNEPYYYEQWRGEDQKIKSRFIGKVSPGIIAPVEQEIQERNNLLESRKEKKEIIASLEKSITAFRKLLKKESILQDYSFEVFWKDELTARVRVNGPEIIVSRYTQHPAKQIFAKEKMSRNQLNEVLALRCFERGRADINEKLKAIGVSSYNPYEIIKKTHGVSYNDFIWIRFPGETLTSADVLVKI